MDDYPNSSDTWSIEPPEERKEAEQKEREKVTSSIGVIKDVVEWFEKNADFYKSVDALNIDDKTTEANAKLAVLLSKKMRIAFESKNAEFRRDFAKYLEEDTKE